MRAIKFLLPVAVGALFLSASASATDYYARGEFNGWSTDNQLTYLGGDEWGGSVTGLTPGQAYEFKIATVDWSINAPNSNAKITADAAGVLNFHFHETEAWGDGWNPSNERRVGYDDPAQFGWEIMGSFNGWSEPVLALNNQSGGLYAAQRHFPAGDYEFKFRKQGDWGISIGGDFGNSAPNATVHVANDGDIVRFELDLVGGAWRTAVVPEPASLALLLAVVMLGIRRR